MRPVLALAGGRPISPDASEDPRLTASGEALRVTGLFWGAAGRSRLGAARIVPGGGATAAFELADLDLDGALALALAGGRGGEASSVLPVVIGGREAVR